MAISGETALYYRDLWAHKMGTTRAENYFLVTLDGMAFGVTGMMMGKVRRLQEDEVLEVFGFDQPLDNHPNSHRLFMRLLTCQEFKYILENTTKVNRISELKGFKTACITKYRKLKSSTGLLTIRKREKLPSGMYKLMYFCEFYKLTFKEVLADWLAREDVKDLRKIMGEEEDARERNEMREEARSRERAINLESPH
jgi:hypothetical protein